MLIEILEQKIHQYMGKKKKSTGWPQSSRTEMTEERDSETEIER